MKVNELIEKLKACPQDARVVVPGYEDGMDEVTGTEEIFVMPDAHKDQWYYGIHDRLIKNEPGAEKVIGLKTTRRYGDDSQ